jgi:hypothetical protein
MNYALDALFAISVNAVVALALISVLFLKAAEFAQANEIAGLERDAIAESEQALANCLDLRQCGARVFALGEAPEAQGICVRRLVHASESIAVAEFCKKGG